MRLSSEQNELREIVRRFFSEKVSSEYLRRRISGAVRRDDRFLTGLAELGLEEGFGGESPVFTLDDLALIAHECGYALVPEPVVEHLLCSAIIPRLMSDSERAEYCGAFNASVTGLAASSCCKLVLDPAMVTVSGAVAWAWGVEAAGRMVAFAETPAGRRAVVFLLGQAGATCEPTSALDLTAALNRVAVQSAKALVCSSETTSAIEDALETLKAAEAAGMCERVVGMTCDYMKTREQFGRPIGSFQAIQQKLADLHAINESLQSLSRFAAWAAIHAPSQRSLTSRAAVLHACEAGPRVCEGAIQCHGGIGFTWEYDLHLYLRRAKTIQSAFALSEARAAELLQRVA